MVSALVTSRNRDSSWPRTTSRAEKEKVFLGELITTKTSRIVQSLPKPTGGYAASKSLLDRTERNEIVYVHVRGVGFSLANSYPRRK